MAEQAPGGTSNSQAEVLKAVGNEHFKKKELAQALAAYDGAIELEPSNHVFYSNRSATHALLGDHEASRRDAVTCVELSPSFLKGHLRLATAQIQLGDLTAAESALETAGSLKGGEADIARLRKAIKKKKKSGGGGNSAADAQLRAEVKRELDEMTDEDPAYEAICAREKEIFLSLTGGNEYIEYQMFPHLFITGRGGYADKRGGSRFKEDRRRKMYLYNRMFESDAGWCAWSKDMEDKITSKLVADLARERREHARAQKTSTKGSKAHSTKANGFKDEWSDSSNIDWTYEGHPDNYDRASHPVWEYEGAGDGGHSEWIRYPDRVEASIESIATMGSPRYMYCPGNPDADGMYESARVGSVPPPGIATRYIMFADMMELAVYTGASRAVRRNGERKAPKADGPFADLF